MLNQSYTGTPTSRRSPLVSLSTVAAGDPVLIGSLPAIALDTAATVGGGEPTFLFGGSFALTVTAKSSLSPSVNHALKPGDPVYADGGTLDATSNMTTGFTLDANTGGVLFGHVDPTGPGLATGTTGTINILLPRGM